MGRRIGEKGIETSGYTPDWEPPSYTVNARGKVVGGYTPPGTNNWGRWGEDDQRGTANLIGPEQIVKAARLIETGEVFSLTHPLDKTAPRWPGRTAPIHFFTIAGSDTVVGHPSLDGFHLQYSDDSLILHLQDATQWDALAHVSYQDVMYNGFWAGHVAADGGAQKLGIEHQVASFTGRGVLIDLPRHLGVTALDHRMVITTDLVDEAAAAQGITFEPGDILLYRTGHLTRWSGAAMSVDEKMQWFLDAPRFDTDCVDWLRRHDFAAFCCDTVSPDGTPCEQDFAEMGPYDNGQPIHVSALIGLGLAIGELFDLERLAVACAEDGRYAFFLCAPPLNVPGAVGSPMNPTAIK